MLLSHHWFLVIYLSTNERWRERRRISFPNNNNDNILFTFNNSLFVGAWKWTSSVLDLSPASYYSHVCVDEIDRKITNSTNKYTSQAIPSWWTPHFNKVLLSFSFYLVLIIIFFIIIFLVFLLQCCLHTIYLTLTHTLTRLFLLCPG